MHRIRRHEMADQPNRFATREKSDEHEAVAAHIGGHAGRARGDLRRLMQPESADRLQYLKRRVHELAGKLKREATAKQ